MNDNERNLLRQRDALLDCYRGFAVAWAKRGRDLARANEYRWLADSVDELRAVTEDVEQAASDSRCDNCGNPVGADPYRVCSQCEAGWEDLSNQRDNLLAVAVRIAAQDCECHTENWAAKGFTGCVVCEARAAVAACDTIAAVRELHAVREQRDALLAVAEEVLSVSNVWFPEKLCTMASDAVAACREAP